MKNTEIQIHTFLFAPPLQENRIARLECEEANFPLEDQILKRRRVSLSELQWESKFQSNMEFRPLNF